MIEPVQSFAGARIPLKGYLGAVQDLCHKHNILFVCDEAQTGLSRAGFDLAFQAEDVKPDLVTLGKAVAGGMYPVSVLVGKSHVMDATSK
ncbi:L-ornithine aminotransferase [Ilyonectria robusta]